MRKIEKEMLEAIENEMSWSKANTEVLVTKGKQIIVKLHGNTIAFSYPSGWYVNNCDWETPTTSSRINALSTVIGSDLWTGTRINKGKMYLTYRHRADELMNGNHPV